MKTTNKELKSLKIYKCNYYNRNKPCNPSKHLYSIPCPVNQYNLPRTSHDNKCVEGLIEIDWTQYIKHNEILNQEFKPATIYNILICILYVLMDRSTTKLDYINMKTTYWLERDVIDIIKYNILKLKRKVYK